MTSEHSSRTVSSICTRCCLRKEVREYYYFVPMDHLVGGQRVPRKFISQEGGGLCDDCYAEGQKKKYDSRFEK